MALLSLSVFLVGIVVATVLLVQRRRSQRSLAANPSRLPFPPGPSPLPVIGNLYDLPKNKSWEAYDSMTKIYGDVVHFNVFGQSIVVLGSAQAITDLIEKRSSNYSDRYHLTMLHDLMGFDWAISLMPYGDNWRRYRKTFYQYFGTHASEAYKSVQHDQSRALLRRLKATPEQFFQHVRLATSATILKAAYGFDIVDDHDKWVDLVESAVRGYAAAGAFGKYLVDILPMLKHIPAWVPGARFQKVAAHYRPLATAMCIQPFEAVKEALKCGTAGPSAAASMIENLPAGASRHDEEILSRNCAAMAYGAGADTTTSALHSLLLAMVLYPEVQQKAQAELDAVVGPHRLPTFDDRPSLPYIEAVIKENLRWQMVTPLAAPHLTSDDDEYRGYHIPKGTVIIGNAWSILHNPVEFPNPESFNPDRFLKDGLINPAVRDPATAAFGFGRRICPGSAMAINSIYSTLSCVLHVFRISHALDVYGRPIPVAIDMSEGVISYPTPFNCRIEPRSVAAEALIDNDCNDL